MATRCSDSTAAGDGAGLRLFGVQLHAAPASTQLLHKSYSMDCLRMQASSSSSLASLLSPSPPLPLLLSIDEGGERPADGYLSDGPHGGATMREKKKGVPWSEQEHRQFLAGLEKLGKGDWRGISRSFVTTRTPTQVASHAQKFFLRQQNSAGKKTNKRRTSLFDMVQDCESGRSFATDPASHCKNNTSASRSLKVSHQGSCKKSPDYSMWASSETSSVSEAAPVVMEQAQAHGYGSNHHCSPLDLELGMSLSTQSIGT
uniref:HTH myb-type domain-containing protein n=1 Tax=Leersia perrieri TaxID=77586 RepID=A0A0D9WKG6_9ORYZ